MAKKTVKAKSSRSVSRSSSTAKVRSVKRSGLQFNKSLFPLVGVILAIIALIAIVFASNQQLGFNTKADDTAKINCEKFLARRATAETNFYRNAQPDMDKCMTDFNTMYGGVICNSSNIGYWEKDANSYAQKAAGQKAGVDEARKAYNTCLRRSGGSANGCQSFYNTYDALNQPYSSNVNNAQNYNDYAVKCNSCLTVKDRYEDELEDARANYDAYDCENVLYPKVKEETKPANESKTSTEPVTKDTTSKDTNNKTVPAKPAQKYDYVCGNEYGPYKKGTKCEEYYDEGSKECHKIGVCDGKGTSGSNCSWGAGSSCTSTSGQPAAETNSSTVCKGRAAGSACYERYAEGDKFCYKFGKCDGEGDDGTHCSWGAGSYCK